jgi:hypothetical protein
MSKKSFITLAAAGVGPTVRQLQDDHRLHQRPLRRVPRGNQVTSCQCCK